MGPAKWPISGLLSAEYPMISVNLRVPAPPHVRATAGPRRATPPPQGIHATTPRLVRGTTLLSPLAAHPSHTPNLRRKRQGVKLFPRFAPCRVVFALQRHEVFAVRWLDEVEYFVDDNILQQIFRLFHELRIETDVSGATIAAPPLCGVVA